MQELIQRLLDEARGMWRFRRIAIITAWVVCLLGWFIVLWIPNKFEAAARVFVDPTSILKPVIENLAVQQDVNAELNLVRQTLLSDVQLEKVINSVGLANNVVTAQQKANTLMDLRERINISIQSSNLEQGNQGNVSPSKVYTISYQDSSRERSLKVVDILLNSFMSGTLSGKREGSQQAQLFLEEQIKDYEKRLSEAEERLANFKKKNVGMVPSGQTGQQQDYFTRLQGELDAVKKAQTAVTAAVIRRDALQKQLRGEAPVAASGGNVLGVNGQMLSGGGDTLSRIKEAQAKLDDLLLRFTDKHPDVVATRQTLEDLKARRENELEGLRRGDANAAAVTGASSNPVYQSIQLALNQATIEIATSQADLRDHQQKVAELRKFVDTMPQVEAEYAQLDRDYGAIKKQYEDMVARLEKARVGEEADAAGAVRFVIIDPPTADYKPVSPRRSLLTGMVLLIGLAVGLGVAFVLNLVKPVYYTLRSLDSIPGVMVLGAVSMSRTESQQVALRSEYHRYAVISGLLLMSAVLVVLVSWKFAPLGGGG